MPRPQPRYLSCPFCYEDVPCGASVCRGCQAEITYDGGDGSAGLGCICAAVLVGFFCYWLDFVWWLSVPLVVGAGVAGMFAAFAVFGIPDQNNLPATFNRFMRHR